MSIATAPPRTERFIIAVADVAGFAKACEQLDDATTFTLLDRFYRLVDTTTTAVGGTVVKFIGDGALMVFPTDAPQRAVEALAQLRRQAQVLWQDVGPRCDVYTRAHVGTVACGPIGPDQRFDIIGREVNHLFMLRGPKPEAMSAAMLAEIEATT